MNSTEILVSGFSLTPKGTPCHEEYKFVGAILLVDKPTHTVVKADFTVLSPLTKEVLSSLIVGESLLQPMDKLTEKFRTRIFTPSIGAVLQAIRAAVERYKEVINNN